MLAAPQDLGIDVADLALLQPDARVAARLAGALADGHRVVPVASWEALEGALHEGAVHGCVVDVAHPDRTTAAKRVQAVRGSFPDVAIIALADAGPRRDVYRLGRLPLDGLVTTTTSRGRLRTAVDQAFAKARANRVGRIVGARRGALAGEAFAWAVDRAAQETSVERMAAELSRTPRRLRSDLVRAGCPGPARVLLWGRLLIAGARLADDGRTSEDVSFSLRYATSKSLARAMKHHTGHTLGEVAEGGMEMVLAALLRELGASPPGRTIRSLPSVALLLFLAGCASLGSRVDRGAIGATLQSPGVARMHVGVLAVDAATGRTLYEHNATRRFVPASNQKILVTAAAMTMLGPDHRFRTEVWATGPVDDGVLDGDLVVVGSGDPSLSGRFWASGTAALEAMADSLRRRGLRRVRGSLVVDASAWDSTSVGPTREVEDLRYGYGSSGGAFAIDEGEVRVVVEGAAAVGSPASVTWSPLGEDDFVQSRLVTAPADGVDRIVPYFLPESRRLVLEGEIAAGAVDTLAFAMRDPVRQASAALARAIVGAGIEVEKGWEVWWDAGARSGRCDTEPWDRCAEARRWLSMTSPPLHELVDGILGPSQNWMTEQLLLGLAAAFGEEGSWSQGTAVVEAFLVEHVGVDSLDVIVRDGSGLSAYNLVTPRALVRVLRFMGSGPSAYAYRVAMAEPGEEGSTLEDRLPDLEGRVFAKTGTISNVNSLSGYLVGSDGREIVFSILANASGLPSSYVRDAIDDIVRALAR